MNDNFKCLIIMHNPIGNQTGNGKTVKSIVSRFDANDIAQIYMTGQKVDSDFCGSCVQISEKNQFLFCLKKIKTNIVCSNTRKSEQSNYISTNKMKRICSSLSRSGIVLYLRNLFWKSNRWKSRELLEFVDDFNPDIIFIVPGYISGLMDCAIYFSKKYNIPMVSFVTDDYYSSKNKYGLNIIKNYVYSRLRHKYCELLDVSKYDYIIGDNMRKLYCDEFKKQFGVIMNCVPSLQIQGKNFQNNKFVYIGSLGLGRDEQLLKIAKAIDEINKKMNGICMEIYTPDSVEDEVINKFKTVKSCAFCGSVHGEKLIEVINNAEYLILTESFDEKYKIILETAMSTKVPEYLSSGRTIFCYGPAYSGSIEYIFNNKLGYCVTVPQFDVLCSSIESIVGDKRNNQIYITKSLEQYRKYHSIDVVSSSFKQKMHELVESNG